MSSVDLSETHPSRAADFMSGVRHGIPVMVASAPFGFLFGALAVQNGLSIGDALLMSITVFAGASQMVGLELFGQHIPAWLIVFSIFAVNLCHVFYSAAIDRRTRHWTSLQRAVGFFFLTDPQYAEGEKRGERAGGLSFVWYMGMAAIIDVAW